MKNRIPDDVCRMVCRNAELWLLPDKAIYWPAEQSLLVADVHAGKEHAFNRQGIALPDGVSERSLERMFGLVDRFRAERLIVLGDFVHAAPDADEGWLRSLSQALDRRQALQMDIVAGNHDRYADRGRLDARLQWHDDTLTLAPFSLRHEPIVSVASDSPVADSGYALAGHLHPVVRLADTRRQTLRLPVFWFRPQHAVLPAFGEFTGGHGIRPAPGDRTFVVGPDRVMPLGSGCG